MDMKVTASKLRENIYNILDQALETGVPIEVERKGRILRIVPQQKPSKLDKLKKRNCLVGDPESIVHMDWLKEWSELKK
jgi:antitoxin (DNA-binding transcriptional repressor) of toxin-antitoxin stability system